MTPDQVRELTVQEYRVFTQFMEAKGG